jgi:hypothetical protein
LVLCWLSAIAEGLKHRKERLINPARAWAFYGQVAAKRIGGCPNRHF